MLLTALKRRILPDEVALTLDDSSSLGVVERLLQSDRWRDVNLGLDLLGHAKSPTLPNHLSRLAQHSDPRLRLEAVNRLAKDPPTNIQTTMQHLALHDPSPVVQGAALAHWGKWGKKAVVPELLPFLEADAPELRKGASVGLWWANEQATVEKKLSAWIESPISNDRILATQILGEINEARFDPWFGQLLQDQDTDVREAVLLQITSPVSQTLLPSVVTQLANALTRSAAFKALEKPSPAIILPLSNALQNGAENDTKWLLHVCRHFHDPSLFQLLQEHLQHPQLTIRKYVLQTLAYQLYQVTTDSEPLVQNAVQNEVCTIQTLTGATTHLGSEPVVTHLHRAIQHDITAAKERLFYLLSFLYDPTAIQRAATRLANGDSKEKALAFEMLEVTLSAVLSKSILPLLAEEQVASQAKPATEATTEQQLRVILEDNSGIWQSAWTKACANYAGIRLGFWEHSIGEGNETMLSIIERVAELNQVAIFDGTPDFVLGAVAQIVEEVTLPTGETFIKEGEMGDCMYLVIEGQVRVHTGDHTIIVLNAGNSVGELAVLDPEPRSASVTTTEPTLLFRLDKKPFDEVMADRPEIAQGVIRTLSHRLREETKLLAEKSV
jgi:HEAT repeat protein